MLLDGGIRAKPKVLHACIGEAALSTDPTQGKTTRPPWALARPGGILAKYASDCFSVATY